MFLTLFSQWPTLVPHTPLHSNVAMDHFLIRIYVCIRSAFRSPRKVLQKDPTHRGIKITLLQGPFLKGLTLHLENKYDAKLHFIGIHILNCV